MAASQELHHNARWAFLHIDQWLTIRFNLTHGADEIRLHYVKSNLAALANNPVTRFVVAGVDLHASLRHK